MDFAKLFEIIPFVAILATIVGVVYVVANFFKNKAIAQHNLNKIENVRTKLQKSLNTKREKVQELQKIIDPLKETEQKFEAYESELQGILTTALRQEKLTEIAQKKLKEF